MKKTSTLFLPAFLLAGSLAFGQVNDSVIVKSIVKEATENSQLQTLATELLDGIGPRLVELRRRYNAQWKW